MIKVEYASDSALIAYLGSTPSPELSHQIQALDDSLRRHMSGQLVDTLPSYASLTVIYNPLETDHFAVTAAIHACFNQLEAGDTAHSKTIELPVYYGEEVAPELPLIAKRAGLSIDAVIDIHSGGSYPVYAIGFAPGFAYLGGLDPRLAAPRLSTPRLAVPKGAVAIADQQTAVYPSQSPGGWNLIGLCPVSMFDADAQPPMPVSVGDEIKFIAIDKQTFIDLGGELPEVIR